MKCIRNFLLAILIFIFALSSFLYAAVPQKMNYQGKITKPTGALVDTTIEMIFTIYDAPADGETLWTETQPAVVVERGVFSAVLGSEDPIPDVVFDGTIRYLGVKVGTDDEMTPRKEIVSVAYAMRAGTADGGGVNCEDCDERFVNVQGPDSVVAGSGAAFFGKVIASTEFPVYGIKGYAYNNDTATGDAYGGYFSTSSFGLGAHYGVHAEGNGESSASTHGCYGVAQNSSSGIVYGGLFEAGSDGTGKHFGVYGYGEGSSSASTYGSVGAAINTSAGDVYGGYFMSLTGGTGVHYGVGGEGYGSSSATTYGSYGYGKNTSDGNVSGGHFVADTAGTGVHYGVSGVGWGGSSASAAGISGYAENTSSGRAIGAHGLATNSATGEVYGGMFSANPTGSGTHYGVYGSSHGSSSSATYGHYGLAKNSSSGTVYGGYFEAESTGTGIHYGVRAEAFGSSSSGNAYGFYGHAEVNSDRWSYGVYGYGKNTSTGFAVGGRFYTSTAGEGTHYAVRATGYGNSSASTYGVHSTADSDSSGNVYGGYFKASGDGSGTKYGVYGSETAGGSGAAVYASGDYGGSGAKYAVVRTTQGNRVLSVIESPEVWFEDFGEGKLANGQAHIELDPLFLETVTIDASNPMKVFVQLNDPDCNGTAVIRGTTGFDVVELDNGNSNASFSYRLVAKRRGYENQRLKQTDMGMDDPRLYPELQEEIERSHKAEQAEMEQERGLR